MLAVPRRARVSLLPRGVPGSRWMTARSAASFWSGVTPGVLTAARRRWPGRSQRQLKRSAVCRGFPPFLHPAYSTKSGE